MFQNRISGSGLNSKTTKEFVLLSFGPLAEIKTGRTLGSRFYFCFCFVEFISDRIHGNKTPPVWLSLCRLSRDIIRHNAVTVADEAGKLGQEPLPW